MKIVFEGFYGYKNAGDDAFVEVSAWGAQKYWNCYNNVFIGASLPSTLATINKKQLFATVKGSDRANFIAHLSTSNYMVSAGGSTFGEIPIHSNKQVSRQFQKVHKKLKLGAIGVSVGPFKSVKDEKRVSNYLRRLSFLAVRDQNSFEYVSSLNLNYNPINAFDLAALLPSVYEDFALENVSSKNKKTIGISICNYERYVGGNIKKEAERNIFFKRLVDLIIENTSFHLKVFIINGNRKTGDNKATSQLLNGIDKSRFTIVPYLNNVKKTWDEIAACDLMISTRLHASIFACYANVPFMLLEYHRKCTDFLNDVGHHDLYRLYDAEVSPLETLKTIEAIISGDYIPPSNIANTIVKATKNFTQTLI